MGGGDLNQKKSWHPHTIKNQEKVWKAEQAKSQEEKRLKELQKEINDERNREDLRRIGESSGVLPNSDADKKLEWMYKSSTELVNRDAYLLGRTIDKSFEVLQAEEQKQKDANIMGVKQSMNHVEHECIPFSIREFRNFNSTEQVDLQRKQMEDPLMLIKQREMESRRKLLENPVKLKELHRILKTDQQLKKVKKNKNLKKSKKSKKSKKKHKKRSKSSSGSDSSSNSEKDSDEDLDAQLAKKYNKIKGSLLNEGSELKDMSLTKLLDAKYETISKELDKAVKGKGEVRKDKNDRRDVKSKERYDHSRSRSPNDRRHRNNRQNYRRRSRSYDNCDRKRNFNERNIRRERSRSNERTRRGDTEKRNRNFNDRSNRRNKSPPIERSSREDTKKNNGSESKQSRRSRSPKEDIPKSTKLSEAEKEARRKEMMENAAWRETDRTVAVKRHREAYEREEQQSKAQEFDKDFINKEVQKAIANHTSVESRIRSNLNNIQRTKSSMNSNFAKK